MESSALILFSLSFFKKGCFHFLNFLKDSRFLFLFLCKFKYYRNSFFSIFRKTGAARARAGWRGGSSVGSGGIGSISGGNKNNRCGNVCANRYQNPISFFLFFRKLVRLARGRDGVEATTDAVFEQKNSF